MTTESTVCPDEMTAFHRDLLHIVSGIGPAPRSDIDEAVRDYYGSCTDQRIDDNLETLDEMGLIVMTESQASRQLYDLTCEGTQWLRHRRRWKDRRLP